ncbi:hypothetical protein jhhlp_001446 [Lomentospora prolificans]|uniref:Uncharacterized protein n=1 Tax=Lomentospora prolificans TaxID=41688 RepID=A0A2N3NIA1_9PEZI|nr:hypothetical protein jhhlp_001446 [Lomentospora prolificans]
MGPPALSLSIEQESLIQTLSQKNSSQNKTFRHLLLALPLLSTLPYLVTPSLTLLIRLIALKSLLATSFLVYALRPEDTGFPALNAWAATASPITDPKRPGPARTPGREARAAAFRGLDASLREHSPLLTWLPYLNIALASVLVLTGLVATAGSLPFSLACLPALVYGLVLASKIVMAGVDPESELRELKYDYKGA